MNKKNIAIIIAIIIVVAGGGGFYGGMKYAQSKTPAGTGFVLGQQFQNLSAEERQQRLQQFQASGTRRGESNNAGFLAGEIISKDDKSVTVKLREGGSKIVFFSSDTAVSKTSEGSISDLEVGQQITVNGSANSDGSITAQLIQVRPK